MNDDAVELTFFTSALMRRWYLPIGFALMGLLAGFVLAPVSTGDQYEAEARLLIRPVTDSVLNSNLRVDQIINEDTERELASSDAVIRDALDTLGPAAPADLSIDDVDDHLTVTVRTDSQVVVMRYLSTDPDIAAAIVDALADSYLEARSAAALAERDRQSELLATAISSSTTQLTAANLTIDTASRETSELADLESRLTRLQDVVAVGQIQGEENEPTGDPIAVLQAQIAAFETTVTPEELAAAQTTKELVAGQISGFRDELVALSTLEIDGGEVIDRASPGELQTSSDQVAYLAVGFLFGLMVGIAAAVALERSLAARRSFQANAAHMNQPPQMAAAQMHTPAPMPAPAPVQQPMQAAPNPIFDQGLMGTADPATWAAPQPAMAGGVAVATAPAPAPAAPAPAPAPGGDLPVLADIPKIPRSTPEPVVVTDPTSPAATSIRRLALLVLHDVNGLPAPSIAIGSARGGEGRTTIAANLACAMQQEGKQVLLVTDAHQSVIAPGVHVLPPGMGVGPDDRAPDDARLQQLFAEARDLVDVVVVDTAPLLDHADGARVAAACDRLVLVGVSGKTTRADVDTAARLVEQNGTRVLGLATTERPNWLARRLDGRSVDE